MRNISIRWSLAWKDKSFRTKTVTGIIILITIFRLFPIFFKFIEKREGLVLNDLFLKILPAYNLSIPIFAILWAMGTFTMIRCIQNPEFFIPMMWSYIFLCLARMITISWVALNAPPGLVPLKDPITSIFYGERVITKDLFFSGHTSTQFLFYLCFWKKKDKMLALSATIIIGIMILIQHVHYTMDVAAAPFFAFCVHKLAVYFCKGDAVILPQRK